MKKKSSKILSSLIVKFTDVLAQNFYFQVKFINFYLREIISFTKKMTLETGASLPSFLRVFFIFISIRNPSGSMATTEEISYLSI